jgi:acetylglutamate kinase
MTIVVKIGGAAIEDAGILHGCAEAVAQLVKQGDRVVIVHGGGKTLSHTLQQLGIKSEFVDGLRVTDAMTRDVALMVLAGIVNKKLVAAMQARGVPALGLCGGDGAMFRARKKQTSGRDLGFVGEISSVDLRWVDAIWEQGGVPVLASLALGEDGEYYNINADEMAAASASACNAGMLVFLTDVEGVKDAEGKVIALLGAHDVAALAANTVISGGMLPKLQACIRALQNGVSRVRILGASQAELLPRLQSNEAIAGTEVTCGDQQSSTTKPNSSKQSFSKQSFSKQGVTLEYSAAK